MDEAELLKYWTEQLQHLRTTSPELPERDTGVLKDLLEERKSQRKTLFNFACYMALASFYLLAGVVLIQVQERTLYGRESFEVLDRYGLEILAVSVFGQIVGVIYIIAHSLWSGKDFDVILKK